jgi:hypothetical protein
MPLVGLSAQVLPVAGHDEAVPVLPVGIGLSRQPGARGVQPTGRQALHRLLIA